MKNQRDEHGDHDGLPARDTRKGAKQDRLKQALRENLKRRKSQARGRSEPASAPNNTDNASPYDRGGEQPDE